MIERDGQLHCQDGEYSHHGKFGDIIYALPTIRACGGGKLYLYDEPDKSGMRMTKELVDQIAPLLLQQPYIHDVVWSERVVRSNLPGFRDWWGHQSSIPGMHLATMGMHDLSILREPWLSVTPAPSYRVLFVFTERYRDAQQFFPWAALASIFRDQAGFIGLPQEHAAFVKHTGVELPRVETENLLDVARAIKGADLLIANLTGPLAIAFALGTPCVVETPDWSNVDWGQSSVAWVGRRRSLSLEVLRDLLDQREAGPWSLRTASCVGRHKLTRPVVLRTVANDGWNDYNFNEIYGADSFQLQDLIPALNISPPQLVVDAGANMGFWSALAASLWPRADIMAIEPNEATHAQLRANAPKAAIVHAALYYGAAHVSFQLPPSGNTALGKCGQGGALVPAVTLNWLSRGRQIDLLKIDIEGGEWNVFENLDVKPRVIIGEFHDRPEAHLRDALESKGYRVSIFPNHFHAVLAA